MFFNKVLIPKQSGSIEIKPAAISADIAVGSSRRRRNSFFDDFFAARRQYKRFVARSKPAILEVLPVPTEGKPADFYGLVGQYTIEASATPTEVNVGDPITLKIKVSGSKYLKPVQMPDLTAITAIAENFKVSDEQASPVIENGFKVFTQTIRARNDKIAEIPPIGLSYFDAPKGRYATVKTRPVKLKVAPTRIVTKADIEGSDFTGFGKSVELVRMGISAHFEGLEALQDEYFSPVAALVSPGYAMLWGAPLGILILNALAKLFTHSTPEKIAARRRRSAFRNACKAARKSAKHPGPEAAQLLAAAMKQYAADRFGRLAKSLTAADCNDVIVDATSDSDTASDYRIVMESCEASTYSPTEVKYEPALVRKVIAMMRTIEKGTKR
ncbi:MAG: BatD family protein [Planctomycetes bacterium]|nr:BatD family protein [Planctomycetota bacterium]